ncbi:Fic family protein [Pseudomonadota bacterium]
MYLGMIGERLGDSIAQVIEIGWKVFHCELVYLSNMLDPAKSAFPDCFVQQTEQVTEQVTVQVTVRVRHLILTIGNEPKAAVELMELLKLRNRPSFQQTYLRPASKLGVIEMTLPDKPRSQNQKYLITDLGRKVREKLRSADDER